MIKNAKESHLRKAKGEKHQQRLEALSLVELDLIRKLDMMQ